MKKRMFSLEEQQEIINRYLLGYSLNQVGIQFGISGTSVYKILKKHNIERRSVGNAVTLRYDMDGGELREHQSNLRKGKPSTTLGKTWTIKHRIERPNQKGENNHFWKGGKTKISQQIKNLVEYKMWRMSIFKRDFFTCQHCGAKNRKGEKYIFDADHIYPFSKILDDYNITSIEEAISCKKLWDIENGRTLCRDCHKKTETWGINQYTK